MRYLVPELALTGHPFVIALRLGGNMGRSKIQQSDDAPTLQRRGVRCACRPAQHRCQSRAVALKALAKELPGRPASPQVALIGGQILPAPVGFCSWDENSPDRSLHPRQVLPRLQALGTHEYDCEGFQGPRQELRQDGVHFRGLQQTAAIENANQLGGEQRRMRCTGYPADRALRDPLCGRNLENPLAQRCCIDARSRREQDLLGTAR